jgi:hypothetical protein
MLRFSRDDIAFIETLTPEQSAYVNQLVKTTIRSARRLLREKEESFITSYQLILKNKPDAIIILVDTLIKKGILTREELSEAVGIFMEGQHTDD